MPTWSEVEMALSLALAALLVACASPLSAAAEENGEADQRVRFQVESAREVANDWIEAVVGVSAEDVDPAALADTVNRTMAWALEQARGEERVQAKSAGYHTHPVYEEGKLRRWRASQDLVLESGDTGAVTDLVGVLQSRLQLRSFQFRVSHETRARVEEALVSEALAAFQERAELVRKSLGAKGFAIHEIDIDTGGQQPPVLRVQHEAMAASASRPPAVEGGSTRLTVTARGSIVLE